MKKTSFWAGLLLVGMTATASAHSHLHTSTPAEGSTVTGSPAQVVLGFSESSHLVALTLTHGSDAVIKVAPLPQQAAPQLTVALPKLTSGAWTLEWRVIGDDGHVTHGSIHFTVAAP